MKTHKSLSASERPPRQRQQRYQVLLAIGLCIVLSVSWQNETGYAAMQKEVGAMGFVNKANLVTELPPLLESILEDPT